MSAKLSDRKKLIIGIIIAATISIVTALLVELFANLKLLTMNEEMKGIRGLEYNKIVFDIDRIVEGDPENGLEYRSHEEYEKYQDKECYYVEPDGYVDKLVLEYTNVSAAYFDIIVLYENRFGYLESCVVEDANPIYLPKSTVNIRKNAVGIWIIPADNNTPEFCYDVELDSVSVRNMAAFNYFRFIFVLLAVLCVGLLIVLREKISEHFEYGFLIVAVCAGFVFCLSMPLSRVGWDEETHLRGVYWLDITGSYEYNSFLQNYIDGSYENLPFEYSMSYEEYKQVYSLVNELSTPSAEDPAVSHPWGTSGFATFSYII
ncbi:MAG: hypothetical protein ACI4R6_03300, partial [Lachnospiraceae bacterium]